MELKTVAGVPYEVEKVYRTFRDRLPDVGDHLPNVTRIEVEVRRKEGKRLRVVSIWHADGDVPAIARRFVPKDLFRWRDHALWDDRLRRVEWRLEPFVLPGLFICEGLNAVEDDGDGCALLRLTGNLDIHPEVVPGVPRALAGVVRPHIERMIVRALTPNLEHLATALTEVIAEEEGRGGRRAKGKRGT